MTRHNWVNVEGKEWCEDCGVSKWSPVLHGYDCIHEGAKRYPVVDGKMSPHMRENT